MKHFIVSWYSILLVIGTQQWMIISHQIDHSSLDIVSGGMLKRVPDEAELITTLAVYKNKLTIEVNEEFKKNYLRDNFFATYEPDIDLSLLDDSIVIMPFILNVIPIIWISGKDYYIESMDKDVYYSLISIKEVIKSLYPKTSWNGNLIPRHLVHNAPQGVVRDPDKEFALAYSGGLDSITAALSYRDKKLLLITVRGQWDVPLENDQLWEKRKEGIREFANHYGHSNAFVSSNFAEFLNWDLLEELSPEIHSWRIDTTEGLGMFGLAAPIIYSKGYPLLKMASSYNWAYPWPSAANPVVDNHLVFAGTHRLIHDQFNYTRVDKAESIINFVKRGLIERPFLKVCDDRIATNCCEYDCDKCIPTAFMLFALGDSPRLYGFDLTDDEIIEKTKIYLGMDQMYYILWELQTLRVKLIKQGNYDKRIDWFMDLDLKAHINTTYVKGKTMVCWPKYKDLATASLNVPTSPEYCHREEA